MPPARGQLMHKCLLFSPDVPSTRTFERLMGALLSPHHSETQYNSYPPKVLNELASPCRTHSLSEALLSSTLKHSISSACNRSPITSSHARELVSWCSCTSAAHSTVNPCHLLQIRAKHLRLTYRSFSGICCGFSDTTMVHFT